MTKQEFMKKHAAMGRVAEKLPDGVDIISGNIDSDDILRTRIHLFSGIESAPKLAGQEAIQGKRLNDSLEVSFLSEDVKVFQIMDENEVHDG